MSEASIIDDHVGVRLLPHSKMDLEHGRLNLNIAAFKTSTIDQSKYWVLGTRYSVLSTGYGTSTHVETKWYVPNGCCGGTLGFPVHVHV